MPPEVIDLDAQATTPLCAEALEAMLPWLSGQHWNPHSVHRGGRQARAVVEAGRITVAALLGADPAGLVFTSGATEANALALRGVMRAPACTRGRSRVISFATEHSCVLETLRDLAADGVEATLLPVLGNGLPDLEAYAAALGPEVALVSAMAINNEIGSIWPIAEMARMARGAGALFHTDAAQAAGKIDLTALGADLVSLSAHKMHGPKGIGALWRRPDLALRPILSGGGQEAGVRSGTQAPILVAGFAAAARRALAPGWLADNRARVEALRDMVLDRLAGVPHAINGPDPRGSQRWPGNLSVRFKGIDAGRLMQALPAVAVSTGSACSAADRRPSHVLAALGLSPLEGRQTLRLGWTGDMRQADVVDGVCALVDAVRRLGARAA